MAQKQGEVLGDTLARGIARAEARDRIGLLRKRLPIKPASGRYGPTKRMLELDMTKFGAVKVISYQIAKRHEQIAWLVPDEDGSWFTLVATLNARRSPMIEVGDYFSEVTLHAHQRALQSGFDIADLARMIRTALFEPTVRLADHATGWFAAHEALWRFDQGVLKTVIRADRLDTDKQKIFDRAVATGDGWALDE